MITENITVGWFDVLVIGFMIWGGIIGRKRGMSEELLDVLKWLTILMASAWGYVPLAELVNKVGHFANYWVHVGSYIAIIAIFKTLFTVLKKRVGKKLVGADLFGKWEFQLGFLAGMMRHFCMVVIFVSLANSKPVSESQVKQAESAQSELFGKNFFPSKGRLRLDILYTSFTGTLIRERLAQQIMKPVEPKAKKK